MQTSICILLYGDYPELANRVLGTVLNGSCGPCPWAQDVRIGLHDISDRTRWELTYHIEEARKSWKCPIITYEPIGNVYKYPTMRKMFYDETYPIAENIMWFDDDSYVTSPTFWRDVEEAYTDDVAMLGQRWYMPLRGMQWEWIKSQAWYNPDIKEPPNKMTFCQGAWWLARTKMFQVLNWPAPELKHCGGDSLLGEAMRHQGFVMKSYDAGVRINADENGEHSKSQRRGYSSLPLGYDYTGIRYDTSHHVFGVTKCVHYPKSESSNSTIQN